VRCAAAVAEEERPRPLRPHLAIDIVGPTMAQVKLNCAIPPRFFTDELAMLKIDGRWQVAQKVFMTEIRE
jgi:hypothetical protein